MEVKGRELVINYELKKKKKIFSKFSFSILFYLSSMSMCLFVHVYSRASLKNFLKAKKKRKKMFAN